MIENENYYQGLFEHSPAPTAIVGNDAHIVRVNNAFCLLTGYSHDELAGSNWADKMPMEEVAMLKDYNRIRQIDPTKAPAKYESSFFRKDGELRHCLISVAQNIVTLIDITDHKIAEQNLCDNQVKLDIALKIAHLGMWEYDVASNLFYFNDTFYAIFGTTAKEMGGYTMNPGEYASKFVHPDDRYVVSTEIQKALETIDPQYSRQIEHRMLYANGDKGYLAARFTIIKDKNRTIKLFGINQDITAIKRAEKDLRSSEKQLRELNQTKDKFFSIIAHDLKSPFNSILGLSQFLAYNAKTLETDKVERYSENIFISSQKAMDLLSNLMEWSRAETGRIKFSPEQINLSQLIGATVELLMSSAIQKSISITAQIPDNLFVNADASMIETILRNLLSNALKFTNSKGSVVIKAEQLKNKVLVSVSDNGVGMSAGTLEKLFRIDENVSTSGTKDEYGTGLGLILCKEFVEKHKGKILAKSELGKGSEFSFTIPDQVND